MKFVETHLHEFITIGVTSVAFIAFMKFLALAVFKNKGPVGQFAAFI